MPSIHFHDEHVKPAGGFVNGFAPLPTHCGEHLAQTNLYYPPSLPLVSFLVSFLPRKPL